MQPSLAYLCLYFSSKILFDIEEESRKFNKKKNFKIMNH